jgi:hypothetical protein
MSTCSSPHPPSPTNAQSDFSPSMVQSAASISIQPIDITITRAQPASLIASAHTPLQTILPTPQGIRLEYVQSANALPVVRARAPETASRPTFSPYPRSLSPPTSSATLSVLRIGSPSVPPSHPPSLPSPPPTFHRSFFHPVPVLSRASSPSRVRGARVPVQSRDCSGRDGGAGPFIRTAKHPLS